MRWINREYRNAYLMMGIILSMFLFMGVSLVYIGDQVGQHRSCITTCHVELEKPVKG